MNKLIISGRMLFAISMIGLGVEHFVFGEFVTGRAPPWPADVPGGPIWAYVSGIVVVLAGLAILSGRLARIAAILLGAMIFGWALIRHIPVVAASEILSGDWTSAVKALAFTGGCLGMAATFPKIRSTRNTALSKVVNYDVEFVLVASVCLAVFMINNGIQHFIYIDFVALLIPTWFPGDAVFWSYFSAVALFAGALGMLYRRTAHLAALCTGIMVFAWVWIVHVPRIFVSTSDMIAVFEAPAIAGIAFVIAGYRKEQAAQSIATYLGPEVGTDGALS
jgi:uncharacterized membrane protein